VKGKRRGGKERKWVQREGREGGEREMEERAGKEKERNFVQL